MSQNHDELKTKQENKSNKTVFDEELIYEYPRSNRRLELNVKKYEFMNTLDGARSLSTHISPHGIEFKSTSDYEPGTLLKICISIPNYWDRKQQLVNYQRIDEPSELTLLAKVVKSSKSGKRSRNRTVIAQTVNIEGVDEKVLAEFLAKG